MRMLRRSQTVLSSFGLTTIAMGTTQLESCSKHSRAPVCSALMTFPKATTLPILPRKILTNGCASICPKPTGRPRSGALSGSTMTTGMKPRFPSGRGIAPGYALRGAVTLVCGAPSAMKSTLMLGWACAIALGRDYGAVRPTAAAPVIIYNVEDDQNEQRRRLSAVLRQFGAQPRDIKGKVVRTGPQTIGTLLTRDDQGRIQLTAAMDRLEQLVAERQPAMLVVDPLAELHTADENDNTALRAVIAGFRDLANRHNIAVVVLHHTRKGSSMSPGDPDIARGASAVIGAVRVAVTLTGMSEDDAKTFSLPTDPKSRSHYVRLDDAKSNYGAIREAQWFEKMSYLLDNGEVVPAAVPWTPPAAKIATQTDLAALVAGIERGAPNGEPWSATLGSYDRSVRVLLDQQGFKTREAQQKALERLMAECPVEKATYRRQAGNRAEAVGLRVGDKPHAKWVE